MGVKSAVIVLWCLPEQLSLEWQMSASHNWCIDTKTGQRACSQKSSIPCICLNFWFWFFLFFHMLNFSELLAEYRNILWRLCSSLLSQLSIRTDFKIGFLSLRVFLCLCSQHFYNVLLWAKIWLLGSGTFNVFYFFPTEV